MEQSDWIAKARRKFGKRAEQISFAGDNEGPFAVLSRCGDTKSFSLWATQEQAEKAKNNIDKGGCMGECTKKHEIVDLEK